MTRAKTGPAPVRSLPGRFLREETGTTAIEYVLISSIFALFAVGGFMLLTSETGGLLTGTVELFRTATSALGG